MRYLKTRCERIWTDFLSWLEWQDAKAWAKQYHPGWLQIAKKSRSEEARAIYRDKILEAYRGY